MCKWLNQSTKHFERDRVQKLKHNNQSVNVPKSPTNAL